MMRDLLDATERRYKELDQTKPPAFLLYIDQGEELYVRAEARQRQRFSEIMQGIADPRLYMLMSMRADFLGELQKDEPLYKVHRKIDVPPLRKAELREVVSRPATALGTVRDRWASGHYYPTHRRGIMSRTWVPYHYCLIRSTTCGRRW